jgi:flagellar hook assembly protein FlgD
VLASFTLARAAKITVTVENPRGIVVRLLTSRSATAGRQRLVWNGRDGSGALAYGGSYRLHVSATNALGRTDLYAPFTARR